MNSISRICLLILILLGNAIAVSADIWHDGFDDENTDAWNIVGKDDVWNVSNGMLNVTVDRDWQVQYELFQLIAFPAPYRDFSIIIKDIRVDKIRLGFGVGRRFSDTLEEDPFFYVFFPDEIRARRFNGRGSSFPFHTRLSREPRTRWDTDNLNTMEIHFNSGLFLYFADGELRARFKDRNFNHIDLLGFVVEGINIANQWIGKGSVDSFTISGLNVTPEVKVTSTWAQLKRR